jgi:hypothetical protein
MDAGAVTCRVVYSQLLLPSPLLCRPQICITPGVAVRLSARVVGSRQKGESSRRLARGLGVAYVTGYIRLLAVILHACTAARTARILGRSVN